MASPPLEGRRGRAAPSRPPEGAQDTWGGPAFAEPSVTGDALQRMAARTLIGIVVIVGAVAALIGIVEAMLGMRALWGSQRVLMGAGLVALGGTAALLYRAARPRVATTLVLGAPC